MTVALKTVLVDALNASIVKNVGMTIAASTEEAKIMVHDDIPNCHVVLNADRLATAVRDHFLDREKVRASVLDAIMDADLSIHSPDGPNDLIVEGNIALNQFVDRLIEGLAGGSEG